MTRPKESNCPECGGDTLGMDVVYTKGACRFCQDCATHGPRVAVSVETLYADQLSLATSAWNEWAEGEATKKLTTPTGMVNDTRFSA